MLEFGDDFDVVEKAKWFLSDNNNHPPPIKMNEEKEEEEKNEHDQQDETSGRVHSLCWYRVSNRFFTDRVHSTRRDVMFSVCPHLGGGGGYPGQVQMGDTSIPGWGYPHPALDREVPQPGSDGGTPARSIMGGTLARSGLRVPQGTPRPGMGDPTWQGYPPGIGTPNMGTPSVQDNRWSTWYAAVGMPLAFTQEDFLVFNSFWAFVLVCFYLFDWFVTLWIISSVAPTLLLSCFLVHFQCPYDFTLALFLCDT